jgi:hypothetical protein
LIRTAAWRQPLTPRLFFLTLAVLGIGLVSLDLGMNGPIAWSVARLSLIEPAEREWGFHAEWMDYGLTVVEVTKDGAFDRAGIKPGFAFEPPTCGFGGPWFGGPYSVFSDRPQTVRVGMLENPSERRPATMYEISR